MSARGRALTSKRKEVRAALLKSGYKNPRVFGSVVHGTDSEDSDIDLLVDVSLGLDLFDLATVERELSTLLGSRVELVPANELQPQFRDRILAEAKSL